MQRSKIPSERRIPKTSVREKEKISKKDQISSCFCFRDSFKRRKVAIDNGEAGEAQNASRFQGFLSSLISSIGGVFAGIVVQEDEGEIDMASRDVVVVPHQQVHREVGKQKNMVAEGRNRRVLQDIGNLAKPRAEDGKAQDQKKITTKKKSVKEVVDEFNKAAQANRPIVGRQMKEANSKKTFKTFSSTLSARSKIASGLEKKPKEAIVDIDAVDAENELAVVEYIDELYSFYKLSEDETRLKEYMGVQPDINAKMRSILVDWLTEVHLKFELMPETLYLTVNIVDRFLSMKVVPRRELQLVGISSMLLASKYEEIWAPEVNDFVCISDNAYVKEQILAMEKAILGKLGWCLTVPTPYVFLVRYIKASIPDNDELKNMVFFLAELGMMHYSAVTAFRPSVIAASSVLAARATLEMKPVWTETLKHHTGYSKDQLMECAKLLASFHSEAGDSKLKAVVKKFSSLKRGAVALHSPAKSLLLEN